jgi:hypothetical protein
MSKCSFATREISYLGYIISSKGVATCPDKVSVILNWLVLAKVKELRSFLGLAGYYKKIVRHFRIISRPLTELLKKNTMFVWTSDNDTAFKTLKQLLAQAPVLDFPKFSKPFHIETDASEYGVVAVLMQWRSLGPKLRGLSTYEKEYAAILLVVEQRRSYLQFQ